MNILLVQCPCAFGVEMPPLALAYLFSVLKKAGENVSAVDLSIELYKGVPQEDRKYWASNNGYYWYVQERFDSLPFINETLYDECIKNIFSYSPDIVALSVQNTSAIFTREIIKRIKRVDPSKKIILGGPNCYNLSGDDRNVFLPYGIQAYADVVVVGEGEQTLLNVIAALKAGTTLDGCAGIVFLRGDKYVFNGFAPAIKDIDALPFPDFEIYDLAAYTDRNSLPMLTSRGCVNKCVYCTDTRFWSPYRFRSAGNILAEARHLKAKYRNSFISFNDSLVNGNLFNWSQFCDGMIDVKLDVQWGGNFRINNRIDEDFLRKMKLSGCEYLILGVETASNKILKAMRKGFTIEEAEEFMQKCARVGIGVVANWIVGFPGETDDDFMETVRFLEKNRGLMRVNTFSMLTINQFSYLSTHKEEFNIVLDGYHLGLWVSRDGTNTIELRNQRLRCLEEIENVQNRSYRVVRQT